MMVTDSAKELKRWLKFTALDEFARAMVMRLVANAATSRSLQSIPAADRTQRTQVHLRSSKNSRQHRQGETLADVCHPQRISSANTVQQDKKQQNCATSKSVSEEINTLAFEFPRWRFGLVLKLPLHGDVQGRGDVSRPVPGRQRGSRVCLHDEGNAKSFVCPYHAWIYGADGSLLAARHMPVDFDKPQFG